MKRGRTTIYAFDAGEDSQLQLTDLYLLMQRAVQQNIIRPDWRFHHASHPYQLTAGSRLSTFNELSKSANRLLRIDFEYDVRNRPARPKKGTLWYIKATLTGTEVDRVLHLHAKQPLELAFPHHPTAVQKMDCARRDAYIRLGVESCQQLLNEL
jgi:hypothetical protein